ncbi:MFS transporter [Corynebacterium hindlerae]|uniref:MFS transporter n=1 Tax=Corynebacterium hindlerae TaxID=699041 RepID=UPI003AACC456
MSVDPRTQLTRRALVVWTAAVLVYVMAITGRTSLGVAGVEATEHFHIDASQLAVFTSVQVGVYALVQIPTGMLIDRFGARRLLFAGALVMAVGQLMLGLTASYAVAIVARVLIGAGDATAFLSVMRILPFWFPLKHTPLFTQLSAAIGQAGQFLSAVPFLALLGARGWQTAFISLGAVGVLVAIAASILISDAPAERRNQQSGSLRDVLRLPVCWMGFFNHFTMLMPLIVFNLLWGMPTMTQGMGLSASTAASVLVINTVCTVLAGPLHGVVSARAGRRRELFSLSYSVILFCATAVFFWPSQPRGFVAIALLAGLLGLLGPASNYGFDSVRENLPHSVVTTGTGLANMGGFLAAMVAAQGIGTVLARVSDGHWSWSAFQVAWISMFVVWGLGIVGLAATRAWFNRERAR